MKCAVAGESLLYQSCAQKLQFLETLLKQKEEALAAAEVRLDKVVKTRLAEAKSQSRIKTGSLGSGLENGYATYPRQHQNGYKNGQPEVQPQQTMSTSGLETVRKAGRTSLLKVQHQKAKYSYQQETSIHKCPHETWAF